VLLIRSSARESPLRKRKGFSLAVEKKEAKKTFWQEEEIRAKMTFSRVHGLVSRRIHVRCLREKKGGVITMRGEGKEGGGKEKHGCVETENRSRKIILLLSRIGCVPKKREEGGRWSGDSLRKGRVDPRDDARHWHSKKSGSKEKKKGGLQSR